MRSTWRLDWEKGWDGVKCNWSQIRSNARQEDNYRGLPRPEISKTWHSALMMAKTGAESLTQKLLRSSRDEYKHVLILILLLKNCIYCAVLKNPFMFKLKLKLATFVENI